MIYFANYNTEAEEKTFDIVSRLGNAWYPQYKSDGRANDTEVLRSICKGDYILCKNGAYNIHAIGIAKSDCHACIIPNELTRKYNYPRAKNGYEVKVEYFVFGKDLKMNKDCQDEIKRTIDDKLDKNVFLIDKNGGLKIRQQYMCRLQPVHAVLLLEKAIEKQGYDRENYEVLSVLSDALKEATNRVYDLDAENDNGGEIPESRNKIFFGAPGTGKSYQLETKRRCYFKERYERVTFHPDYTYANFVGTYKPVVAPNDKEFKKDNMAEWKQAVSILTDKEKSAQEKYDEIVDAQFSIFTKNSSRLPLVLGLYCDDCPTNFVSKSDPSDTENDGLKKNDHKSSDTMINHGESDAVRQFVKLYSGPDDYLSSGTISYEFVPGPFMRVYVEAKSHPNRPYLLIIEEINRADVAAVFGDVFQLLDRVDDAEDGIIGESRYPVHASNDVKNYLSKELGGDPDDYSEISIPRNMYIWATMNSADQGVFPLDTAFKRRWDFEYVGINNNENDLAGKRIRLGRDGTQIVEWNALRKAINDCLAINKVNEDKQLGPYFIDPQIIDTDLDSPRSEKFIKVFKDKVLMYLYEDAGRQIRPKLFDENLRYSDICEKFDNDGIKVFKNIDFNRLMIRNPQDAQADEGPREENNR